MTDFKASEMDLQYVEHLYKEAGKHIWQMEKLNAGEPIEARLHIDIYDDPVVLSGEREAIVRAWMRADIEARIADANRRLAEKGFAPKKGTP